MMKAKEKVTQNSAETADLQSLLSNDSRIDVNKFDNPSTSDKDSHRLNLFDNFLLEPSDKDDLMNVTMTPCDFILNHNQSYLIIEKNSLNVPFHFSSTMTKVNVSPKEEATNLPAKISDNNYSEVGKNALNVSSDINSPSILSDVDKKLGYNCMNVSSNPNHRKFSNDKTNDFHIIKYCSNQNDAKLYDAKILCNGYTDVSYKASISDLYDYIAKIAKQYVAKGRIGNFLPYPKTLKNFL